MYVDGDRSGWLANSAVGEVSTSTSTFLGYRGSSLHSRHIHGRDRSRMGSLIGLSKWGMFFV